MHFKVYFLILLASLGLALTSCYKKQDTIAVVRVVNENGAMVSNARVILYGNGNQGDVVLRDTVFTNSNGEALFNFNETYQSGQAGVAVLDIEVQKDGLQSNGIIKITEETTSRATVILN